jgi:hypothetical protein
MTRFSDELVLFDYGLHYKYGASASLCAFDNYDLNTLPTIKY